MSQVNFRTVQIQLLSMQILEINFIFVLRPPIVSLIETNLNAIKKGNFTKSIRMTLNIKNHRITAITNIQIEIFITL